MGERAEPWRALAWWLALVLMGGWGGVIVRGGELGAMDEEMACAGGGDQRDAAGV
jgi:hypothetical protein